MNNFNFDDPDFLKMIEEKAPKIIKQLRTGILDTPEYNILYSQYLYKYWEERVNKKQMFVIYIKETDIKILDFHMIPLNLKEQISHEIKTNNEIFVDNEFRVIDSKYSKFSDTNEAYKYYKKLSQNGYCIFFFGHSAVESFIKGESEDMNIFYCEEDLERYSEKKDITEIKEVFRTYQNHYLTNQCEYNLFFENIQKVIKIDPKCSSTNILKNKPEKLMRDHLRKFLNENMQYTFLIETELAASKKKLDIYTEVNGRFYFFEIKWLGTSINDEGTEISTTYSDSRARSGVKQTLEYVKELIEIMDINVKCGYLVIFDARDNKVAIDYNDYTFIDDGLKKYQNYFDKIDNLYLENKHPA